ncbi:hypothetical protein OMF49_11200 [Bordetella pertussis]
MSTSAADTLSRPSGRAVDALRPFSLERGFTRYAEGSVLVRAGNTHVLCTASVLEKVPPFLKGRGEGWVTAEYGMLPRATHTRGDRVADRVVRQVAAVSVGLVDGRAVLDLDYQEDSACAADVNVVMTGSGAFVEVQGTGEGATFTRGELDTMLGLAEGGIAQLVRAQREALQ